MGSKYKHNYLAFRVEVLKSEFMVVEMAERAERVAEEARRTAPVRTGRYRASINADTRMDKSRVRGTVTADVPYAAEVEFGNRNHSGHHTLSRALDAAR